MNSIPNTLLIFCLLAVVSISAAGQEKKNAGYDYYFTLAIDGSAMDDLWPLFNACVRGLKYGIIRAAYIEPEDPEPDRPTDMIPAGGTIDKDGRDAVIGPFKSELEMKAAAERVKECLESSAKKLHLSGLSHWIVHFKQAK